MKKITFYTFLSIMFCFGITSLPAQNKSKKEQQKQVQEAMIKLEQAKQQARKKSERRAEENKNLSAKERKELEQKLAKELNSKDKTKLQYEKARDLQSRAQAEHEVLSEEKMRELQYKMQELQEGQLQEVQEKLREVNWRHLRHMAELELPEINVEIPEFDFEMPEFNFEMPEFDFEIPDIDFDGTENFLDNEGYIHIEPGRTTIYRPDGARKLFKDLGDDEQIKIQAIYALDKDNAAATLPVLEKLLEREASPAIRFSATRKLRYFLQEDKSVELLGKIARTDPNIKVRKQAISLLGKNGSKKAKRILQDLAKQ